MKDSIQKAINRMSRASLGVMRSTPVSFLQSMGGSMPAGPRPRFRQACYASRTAGSESEGIRDITAGSGELAQSLRASIPGGEARARPGSVPSWRELVHLGDGDFQAASMYRRQTQEKTRNKRESIGQSSSPRNSSRTTQPTGRMVQRSPEVWPPELSPHLSEGGSCWRMRSREQR